MFLVFVLIGTGLAEQNLVLNPSVGKGNGTEPKVLRFLKTGFKVTNNFLNVKKKYDRYLLRKRVKIRNFSIISNNCWGGSVYQDLGLKYTTPTIGLFFYAPCYIKMLKNLDFFLKSEIRFISKSKYEDANTRRENGKKYPIGLLGEEIEIHFVHYATPQEAKEKWNRRLQRLNMENLFISFSDRDLCEPEHIKEFDNLPFKHKVCFTAKEYPNYKSVVWLKGYKNEPYIGDIVWNPEEYKKYFDVANWLNDTS
ncbi:Uncharacterised protein [uncultured archaeon]|nr:Uncharacterised protein [uncultured archaeon]